jgi:hypothetical protein
MGLAEGALTGTKVKEEPKQAAGTTPAPTPAKAAVGSTVLPSGRPFDPNNPPEAIPGQLKSVHAADVKAWEDRHKLYTKQVDSIADARTSAEQTLADINQLLTHPGLSGNVGKMGLIPNMPGSESSNAQALIDKVKGGTFLSAVQKMKGSGSVSNIEGDKAQAAIAALSQKQSEAEFRKNLIEYANTIKRTMNTASGKIGEAPDYPEVSRAGQTSDVRKRADDIIGRK